MINIDETLRYKGEDGAVLSATVITIGTVETIDKETRYYNCKNDDGELITLREDQLLRCEVEIDPPTFSIGMKVAYTDYETAELAVATITDIKIELSLSKKGEYEVLTSYTLHNGIDIFEDEILLIQ